MSKRDKMIAKICNGSQVSFEEVKALLVGYGFSSRQAGSHVTFAKEAVRITLVAGGQVKPAYLTQLCAILRGLGP